METLTSRLEIIKARIAAAAARSGRRAHDVQLCAVSKTFPAAAVQEAANAGQTLFGESRVQEAVEKIPQLPGTLRWHLIGHLQSNKVRKILPLVEMIQSVDSVELARDINRIAEEMNRSVRVLLQVNVAGDDARFGFSRESIEPALESISLLAGLQVAGLMTIPPLTESADESRPHFSALRECRDRLAVRSGLPLPELSMGMSGDYETAIEEGATLVRVGSALFGAR